MVLCACVGFAILTQKKYHSFFYPINSFTRTSNFAPKNYFVFVFLKKEIMFGYESITFDCFFLVLEEIRSWMSRGNPPSLAIYALCKLIKAFACLFWMHWHFHHSWSHIAKPDFHHAMAADKSKPMFESFVERVRKGYRPEKVQSFLW